MRKQYHFSQGDEEGLLDAWDVNRLIELAADLPIVVVDLAKIWEVHSVYWFDDETQRPTVETVADHARLLEEAGL